MRQKVPLSKQNFFLSIYTTILPSLGMAFSFTQTDLYKKKLATCILGWNQFTGEKV
jgi:hypothetical protein